MMLPRFFDLALNNWRQRSERTREETQSRFLDSHLAHFYCIRIFNFHVCGGSQQTKQLNPSHSPPHTRKFLTLLNAFCIQQSLFYLCKIFNPYPLFMDAQTGFKMLIWSAANSTPIHGLAETNKTGT